MIKKYLITIMLAVGLFLSIGTQTARAVPCPPPSTFNCLGGCSYVGQCAPSNNTCEMADATTIADIGGPCGSAIIGGITAPQGVGSYNCSTGLCTNIGIFSFISVALRLFTVICGLFMFFNFLWAGYALITKAGDTKAFTDVRERLQYAMIGLVIIVSAYMLAAIIGLVFFGNAGFILKPDISQYGATAP